MGFKKITAIVRSDRLEQVEERLKEICVRGLSVSHLKGYGEYANFFSRSWLVRHARIEIFVAEQSVESTVEAIVEVARTGEAGDGLVAVLPVEDITRIRTGSPPECGEL